MTGVVDFGSVKTFSIKQRRHKVKLEDLLNPAESAISIDSADFIALTRGVVNAYQQKKQVILMIGASVIKTGMSLIVIDLMKRGIVTHVAMNGACPIHDFELAFHGETSEYVEKTLEDGTFGMVEETGRMLNEAINEGAKQDRGMGFAIGKSMADLNVSNKSYSILYNAFQLGIPATVHVAIGTDTIHQHPSCDGAATGKASYADFKLLTTTISQLEDGVVLNIGSAVILPEVFLKGLTIARNLGHTVEHIMAANFDMFDHYRPRENVVHRPTSLGGKGFVFLERHEIAIPSLHRGVVGSISKDEQP